MQGSLGTGPASYNPDKRKNRNISYTMGSRLDDIISKKNHMKPGPGKYEAARNSKHGKTSSFSFGRGLRTEECATKDLKANPGAAQYS